MQTKRFLLRRLISVILTLAMMFAVLPAGTLNLSVIADDAPTSTPISNRADLEAINSNMSGTYHLVNDIDLSLGGNWTPLGSSTNRFTGTLDGRGYTIKNMTININQLYVGLFAISGDNAQIRNLRMENVNITGTDASWVGAIVGYIATDKDTIIENCSVSGTITSTSDQSYNPIVGGIVGHMSASKGIIRNCYNTATITATATHASNRTPPAGGIVGCLTYGKIFNCYNSGSIVSTTIQGTPSMGGIIGEFSPTYTAELGDNYYLSTTAPLGVGTVALDAATTKSLNASEMLLEATFAGFDFDDIWEMPASTTINSGFPILQKPPTPISTLDGLKTMAMDGKYILTNDINIPGASSNWTPLGSATQPFTGSLNGNGYAIKNMRMVGGFANGAGLFSVLGDGAKVKNLRMQNVYINAITTNAGGIAASITGAATIEKCTVSGHIFIENATAPNAGGIAGSINNKDAKITDCYNTGNVKATHTSGRNSSAGGIVGNVMNGGEIKYVYSSGNIEAVSGNTQEPYAGGIIGSAPNTVQFATAGKLENCYFLNGTVSLTTTANSRNDSQTNSWSGRFGTSSTNFRLTEAQMRTQNLFANFDFDDTWAMPASNNVNRGFPILQALHPVKYTVSFNGGTGGEGTMASAEVEEGDDYTIPGNTFTRTDHNFSHWVGSNGINYKDIPTITNVQSDITLTAQWTRIPHTITFMPNGGTGNMESVTVEDGKDYKLPNSAFTAPAGKVFRRWTTAANGSNPYYVAGETINNVTADITLYAYWEDIKHSIIYFPNGAPQANVHSTVNDGGNHEVRGSNTFTYPGHIFTGWNTDRDGNGTAYAEGDIIENVTADMIDEERGAIYLYAQWEEIQLTHTITFNANGGTGNMASVTVADGADYVLPLTAGFTPPTGKYFGGWARRIEPTVDIITTPTIKVTGDITLYAYWKDEDIAPRTITFNANGGTGEMDEITVRAVSETLPANGFTPPEDNMMFVGWGTTGNDKVVMLPGVTMQIPVTGITLYAIWAEIVTVTFDKNGGTGEMEDAQAPKGFSYTPPVSSFTPPEGLEFKGWATSAAGAVAASFTFTEDATLYAIWGEPVKPSGGIDYSAEDVIVPGVGEGSVEGFAINLTQETIKIADGYTVAAFSIDGGAKWKAAKADTFSAAKFNKLLNKDLTLHLSNKPIDKSSKKPAEDADIITFAKINKRPKIDKLVVNYLIGADVSGVTTGEWVLSAKGGTASVKATIEVGVANGKTVDDKGWGRFAGADGTANGISIMPLTGAKPAKTVYFIRTAPKPAETAGGEFTAASKSKKINVLGEQKAPNYKVSKGEIKYKANTIIHCVKCPTGEKPAELMTAKGEWKEPGEEILFWMAATAKKPASAKQNLTLDAPAAPADEADE